MSEWVDRKTIVELVNATVGRCSVCHEPCRIPEDVVSVRCFGPLPIGYFAICDECRDGVAEIVDYLLKVDPRAAGAAMTIFGLVASAPLDPEDDDE